MNRSRVLLLAVFLLFLTLSACVKTYLPGPTVQPFPDDNFIHTSVASTLTALVLPSITPSLAAIYTQTVSLANQTPHDFIYYYFDAINARNYPLTWSLLTDRFKARLNGTAQGGYAGYVAFWNSVKQVTVKNAFYVCDGDLCAVNTSLQLNYTTGVVNTSSIDYTVIYDHSSNTWMFDFIPQPTATASRTFTATVTRTRTATPTATKTSTPTSTATKTSTRTQTASATPSLTPSSTGTLTSSPTFTLTPTGTPTFSPTFTPTSTVTLPPSPTFTPTPTIPLPTYTPSVTPTVSPTGTPSATFTPTPTVPLPTFTPSATPTVSSVATGTLTPTLTATGTNTATWTPSETPTPTPTTGP